MKRTETAGQLWQPQRGEMAARIAALDAAATPLGARQDWPQALRFVLELMLPAQAQMVVFWGPDLITFYNDAYVPSMGAKHPGALGRPMHAIWPEIWNDVGPLLHSVLATGETVAAKDRLFEINRQGFLEQSWFDLSYSPIRGQDGSVDGILAVVSETTDRRQATEATLRQSEGRFRALAQVMPNQVWTADPHGRLDWLNQRILDYAGLDADTLLGDGWAAIVHPDDLARVGTLWAQAIATGAPYEAEFRIRRHDDVFRWHLVRAVGVDSEAQSPRQRWVGTNTDIHDQKSVQDALAGNNALLEQRVEERTRDLQETEARLHQSQKMEALGQLTGGIAHDFNNLLQGITGAVEVLRRRVRAGQVAEADRYADAAIQSAHRAAALVQRLLAFARRQALDPQAVDTNALVQSMEDLLRRTLGENIQLDTAPAADAWPARCDPNQLESAILNLAINARDAMPQGGRLLIATGNQSLGPQQLQDQETLLAGEYATLTVSDSGAGMDARVLARVFEPFFTTKPVGQGTGLGLPMIYGFARQSGGGVRMHSEPGRGTTVTLYLPRHAQAAPAAVQEALQVEQGGGEVVLVVEDEPSVRLLVIDALHELGYRTVEAANGDVALRVLHGDGRIDLLVSDVGLPGINGRQLAEQARAQRPGLPVLLMTGYAADAADRPDFLPEGVHLLTKPFAMAALSMKVKGLMGGGRF